MKKGRIAAFLRKPSSTPFQRWRALKRGFVLQITNTLPRRRTTLQSRWRFFADLSEDNTFMSVLASSIRRDNRLV